MHKLRRVLETCLPKITSAMEPGDVVENKKYISQEIAALTSSLNLWTSRTSELPFVTISLSIQRKATAIVLWEVKIVI